SEMLCIIWLIIGPGCSISSPRTSCISDTESLADFIAEKTLSNSGANGITTNTFTCLRPDFNLDPNTTFADVFGLVRVDASVTAGLRMSIWGIFLGPPLFQTAVNHCSCGQSIPLFAQIQLPADFVRQRGCFQRPCSIASRPRTDRSLRSRSP